MARKTNVTKKINGKEYKYNRKTLVIGHYPDGKPIVKEFTAPTENEAITLRDDYKRKLESGLIANFESLLLQETLYRWLFQVKLNELKPSSFQSYEGTYRNYIKDSDISMLPICKIKSLHIQEYYNKLGKTKSFSQIKKLNKLLKSFFTYAENQGYILKNPCNNITIPNKNEYENTKTKKIVFFTEEEIQQLKLAIKGHKFENLILVALGTGLRQGELLALKWENVNLKDKYIKVEETIKKVYVFDSDGNKKQETLIQRPKTSSSIRIVDLPESIVEIFKSIPKNSEFVFVDENKKPYSAKTIFGNWQKILANNNITYKKFHSLRHTYATMLLTNGVDLKTVQDLMGHYDITITQLYLHILPKTRHDAVNRLDYIFKTDLGKIRENKK